MSDDPAEEDPTVPLPLGLENAPGSAGTETALLKEEADPEPAVARGVADLERHEIDAQLLELARTSKKAEDRLRDILIGSTIGIIRSWIWTGRMWREAALVGIPAPLPGPPPVETAEIGSLAAEVVRRAYQRFARVGLHSWSPLEGMSLHTWFINDCKHQFANAVRAWSKDRRVLTPDHDCDLGIDHTNLDLMPHRPVFGPSLPSTPEEAVIEAMNQERLLDHLESDVGPVGRFIFIEHGINERSFAALGRTLGLKPDAVSRKYRECQDVLLRLLRKEE